MFTSIAPCNPCGQLRMSYCIILWTFEDISRTYVKTLAYTTGTTSKHQSKDHLTWIISKVNSIPTHCSVSYESVLSLAQRWRLRCRMLRRYQKRSKKCISTLNFETSSHENVTAKKPIGNMYVDMAWFQSLSTLENDMQHSTVWLVHKICPMSVCWQPYLTRTKRILFCLSLPECYPYNRNLWFLLTNFLKRSI